MKIKELKFSKEVDDYLTEQNYNIGYESNGKPYIFTFEINEIEDNEYSFDLDYSKILYSGDDVIKYLEQIQEKIDLLQFISENNILNN